MFSIHEIQFCIFTVVKNVEVFTNALVKQEKKTTNISGYFRAIWPNLT
jgi:hypothetical protein